MLNQQAVGYIQQQLAAGKSQEEIKAVLVAAGWSVADVEQTLSVSVPVVTIPPPKPKIIKVISGLYWIITALSLIEAFKAQAVLKTLDDSVGKGIPGTLPYSYLRVVPALPIFSLAVVIAALAYLYAALKITNGSNKAWKIALIVLVGVFLLSLVSGFVADLLTKNLMPAAGS